MNFKKNILFYLILLFCGITNAQDLRVIDNKGTLKSINKVSYGTLVPSTTSAPNIPNNEHTTGDIYIIGSATAPGKTYIFDGSQWTVISCHDLVHVGHFLISNTSSPTITGLPFKPSKVTFVAHTNIGVANIDSDNGVGNNNSTAHNSFGSMNGYATETSAGVKKQQVIYVGGSGNSINDISRYASSSNCIGLRFSNQNGNSLGLINASLTSFNNDGFTLNISYTANITTRTVLVMYMAYR